MSVVSNPYISKLFCVANKNVLITGGSRGIGKMIATAFVQAGANVLITSRSEQQCQETAQLVNQQVQAAKSSAGKCYYVASNVSTREGCDELVQYTSNLFDSKLHVLINNAGTSWGEPLSRNSSTKSNWGFDKVLDLNVKGMFYLTRACIPLLTGRPMNGDDDNESSGHATLQDPSRIINIGSIAGMTPQEAPTHAYDISKAAVHHLTRKLAADFARKHITVNAVAPGFVETRMSQGLATWGGDAETLASNIPLGRMGELNDMAGACIYLASPAGSWCTGVILPVDGGAVGAQQIPIHSNL